MKFRPIKDPLALTNGQHFVAIPSPTDIVSAAARVSAAITAEPSLSFFQLEDIEKIKDSIAARIRAAKESQA